MNGRVYLLGVGITLVALTFAFTDWALGLQPGVTVANARRVRAGMTQAEVEAILGAPKAGPVRDYEIGYAHRWRRDGLTIWVAFDRRLEQVRWVAWARPTTTAPLSSVASVPGLAGDRQPLP